jgi:hypothetical protein
MTLPELFPVACGVLYLAAAATYAWGGQWWLAEMYAAYALANVGLVGVAIANRS